MIAAKKKADPPKDDSTLNLRIVAEGYGPSAWHGATLKVALAGVSSAVAFWRPHPGRHNIAEIALHHAWYVRSVTGRLTAGRQEPFVLPGQDWFELPDASTLGWTRVTATLAKHQKQLVATISGIGGRRIQSPLSSTAQFDLILGITCHAVYHAGQVQLIKALHRARGNKK